MTDEYVEEMSEEQKRIRHLECELDNLEMMYEATKGVRDELEKENAELKEQNKDLCESLDIMNNRESELLEQIEKMKNVGNCKHTMQCADWVEHHIKGDYIKCCINCDKWEVAE